MKHQLDLGTTLRAAEWPADRLFLTQDYFITEIIFSKELAIVKVDVFFEGKYLPAQFHFTKYEFTAFWLQFRALLPDGDVFKFVDACFAAADARYVWSLANGGDGLYNDGCVLYGYPSVEREEAASSGCIPLFSSQLGQGTYWAKGKKMVRPASQVAAEIFSAWGHDGLQVPEALPYLKAMLRINQPTDCVGSDSAETVLVYAHMNLKHWRTELGRRYRAELQELIKFLKK